MTDPVLLKAARDHAAAENVGDLEGTLATLEEVPVFELWPIGLRLIGMAAVRRYYEHFLGQVSPRLVRDEIVQIAEWVGPTGVNQAYFLPYRYPTGEVRRFHIVSELAFGETKLSGERMCASEDLFRIMYATVWDEMTVIEGGDAWAREQAQAG